MSNLGQSVRHDGHVRQEALAWLSRLRSSSNERDHAAFESWYCAEPLHADIYDDVLATWEKTVLAGQTAAAGWQQPQRSKLSYALAAAAAIVLVVATSLVLIQTQGPSASGKPEAIAARIGEIRTIALADGSRITLDSGSSVEVAYTNETRRVTLERGRARFEVADDADRPFVVAARDRSVIAHGTVFDVSLLNDRLTVSLLEGSIEIVDGSASERKARPSGTFLAPGQRMTLRGNEPMPPPLFFEPSHERWPSGMISFEDAPLRDVIEEANRYSVVQIRLADASAGQLRFTGSVRAGDPGELAEMLSAMFRLSRTPASKGEIVLAKPSGAPK